MRAQRRIGYCKGHIRTNSAARVGLQGKLALEQTRKMQMKMKMKMHEAPFARANIPPHHDYLFGGLWVTDDRWIHPRVLHKPCIEHEVLLPLACFLVKCDRIAAALHLNLVLHNRREQQQQQQEKMSHMVLKRIWKARLFLSVIEM